MSSVLYLLTNFIFNTVFFLIYRLFLHSALNKKTELTVIISSSLVLTLCVYISEEAVLHFSGLLTGILIKEVVFLITAILFCLLCFDDKVSARIYTPVLVILLQTIFKLLYCLMAIYIVKTDLNNLFTNNTEYRIIFSLVTNSSFLLMIYIINKIKNGGSFLLLFFPLILCMVFFIPFGTASNEHISDWNMHYLLIIILSVIIITAAIIILSEKIIKNNQLKTQNLIIQNEQEIYKKQIKEASGYIEEIAKIKHNMKNQIFCISELISNGNTDEAVRLCDDIKTELNNSTYIFNTDNIYLNSILNVIYKKARENNIDIKAVIKTDLKYISGTDIISLLGNLCDNAIEALCKENNNKELNISLFEKGNNYIISVKNHISSSVLTDNKDLKTSKENPLFHGFGLKTVNSIVKKYNGISDISEKDDMFIVNIMINIPSTTK